MKKIDKAVADQYFRKKNRYKVIYFIIWFIVSYGCVLLAEPLSSITIMGGFPFHYFMGAQGAVVSFIILLFINAKVGDMIDKKYGIDEEQNIKLSAGKSVDH